MNTSLHRPPMRAMTLGLLAAFFVAPTALAQTLCSNENPSILSTTPGDDFEVHADGAVTHIATGLMWMRCALGQTWTGSTCSGEGGEYNWAEVHEAVVALNAAGGFAGYDDWRLPNIKELASIVEERCWDPAINETVFPNTPAGDWTSAAWSSTPNNMGNAETAFQVRFHPVPGVTAFATGQISASSKLSTFGARLVRDAP